MTSTQTAGTEQSARTTQVHRIDIEAAPERIWAALTDPAENGRYRYGAAADHELRPGGSYRSLASEAMKQGAARMGCELPEVIVDGEVLAADPPRRLVQTWRMLMDPAAAAEGSSRLTYEIEGPGEDGVCRLTVVHERGGMPTLAAMTSGDDEPFTTT